MRRLADRVGILAEYTDHRRRKRLTSDATRVAILRALGMDASTPEAARAALDALDARERSRLLGPAPVVRDDSGGATVPERSPAVRELAGRDRVFGITTNLYTLRSQRSWGIGDLTDLATLGEWAAGVGGAFVGINPLHALRNRGTDVSPYSPLSRLFRNPIYLDVEAVPELKLSDEARRRIASPEVRARRDALRASAHVAYEGVWALKRSVLEPLHRAFRMAHGHGDTERGRAYRRFLEEHAEALEHFATFQALAEELGSGDWREWPERYRDRSSPAVASFRDAHPGRIDFHRWLQFEIDRQLAEAAARAEAAGLAIGLYQDLAIGSAPGGADAWAYPGLFVHGVTIGAPPDEYAARGQNWGVPPLDPVALREDGYRYWIRLVRAALCHGGALRIDHAAGLFRQFWIPAGADAGDGAYVRYPSDDLIGILVLEAKRHGAVLVGEDLGTVPPEVPPALHRRGILSSRVLYFEREGGEFRASDAYEAPALVTANTHDLVPLAGFWSGRDIEMRLEAGLIGPEESERQSRERARAQRALLERLAAEGMLRGMPPVYPELAGAVHAFLCRTPASMVGLSLDDLVGETEPVNLPGAPPDRFRSWTRKLSVPLEELGEHAGVRAALRCNRGEAGASPRRARPDG